MQEYARIFIGGVSERERDRGRRDREQEGGWATRNSLQLIIKKSWQSCSENWHGFWEAGSSKLKRQKWLQKTVEMIIKGDLDRMAEEIGHPGNVQCSFNYNTLLIVIHNINPSNCFNLIQIVSTFADVKLLKLRPDCLPFGSVIAHSSLY